MKCKTMSAAVCGIVVGTLGLFSAHAAEGEKAAVKGGIEGKIVRVDADKGTVTIADVNQRERTFSITNETIIVGPRGGIVKRRLKDARFHNGLSITVVANG